MKNYTRQPTKLYRIEHPETGEGPLSCSQEGFNCKKYACFKFPTPYEEELPFDTDMYVATRSKKQLSYWFNHKDMKVLAELGYKVMVYSVKDKRAVYTSKHQVTFCKNAVQVENIICPKEFK